MIILDNTMNELLANNHSKKRIFTLRFFKASPETVWRSNQCINKHLNNYF